MKLSSAHIIGLLAMLMAISSCGPTRRLSEGEYLLASNKIHVSDAPAVSRGTMDDIIKQQPNPRFLGLFKLSLWAHNLPNPDVVAENAAEKRAKHVRKSEERMAEGKKPRRYKRTFGEWLQNGVGTPPVVLDSSLALRSANQISLYLLKEGYFQNEVTHEIKFPGSKKAVVHYYVHAGPEYTIRNITRVIPDPNLKFFADEILYRSHIKENARFSVTNMDNEREMLTNRFKNNGYYDITKDDIYFQVDSTVGNLKVDLLMGIHQRLEADPLNPDSMIEKNHIRYRINEVVINRSYDPFANIGGDIQFADTAEYKSYKIVGNQELKIKPSIIAQNVRFESGQYFDQSLLEGTYRSLNSLDIFSAVNIKFERLPSDVKDEGFLNSLILLTPAKKQQFIFETRGTHNSGFFGTAGSVTYRNKNFFRGAEVFRFKISGAFEAQQLLTSTTTAGETSTNLQDQTVFNTVEFVPEISLTIPKFLFPINLNKIAKSARPYTIWRLSYGFQRRPDFQRNLLKTSLSYRWQESRYKTWIVSPLEVSLIKINKSQQFQQRLDDLNDLFLNASYSDHLISAFKVSYIFNNQILTRKTNTFYYRANAETAGNTLNAIMGLTGAERDTMGSFRIANIRYAHYVRTDHDLRFYRRLDENTSLVFRFFGGIGIPLRNLEVLPFERSFFSGGVNGLRAWQIQTLGPGSYSSVRTTYDRIGETQLEFNVEYRQKLISIIEGALFADAGNVWLLKPDPVRPGGDFAIDRFMNEIALGAGLGLRLNFDFFIIRFDLAMQIHDPAMALGERWVFQPKEDYNQRVDQYNSANPDQQAGYYSPRLNLNLGIGYPF